MHGENYFQFLFLAALHVTQHGLYALNLLPTPMLLGQTFNGHVPPGKTVNGLVPPRV